jgi:hypothetical protein
MIEERSGFHFLVSGESPANDRILRLSVEENAFRDDIRRTIASLDRGGYVETDRQYLMKEHFDDELQLTYGGDIFTGIPVGFDRGSRPRLQFHTDGRNVGLFIDAISEVRLLATRVGAANREGDDVQNIDAEPVARPVITRGRGAPRVNHQLRHAQRVRTAILHLAGASTAPIPWRILEEVTGESRRALRKLEPVLSRLDRRIDLDDKAGYSVDRTLSPPRDLTGGEAFSVRIDIEALDALGPAGRQEALGINQDRKLFELRDRLDEFLIGYEPTQRDEAHGCAANVVAACATSDLDPYALRVTIDSDPRWRELLPIGMRWDRTKWFIQGTVDGRLLEHDELALPSITHVEEG